MSMKVCAAARLSALRVAIACSSALRKAALAVGLASWKRLVV
jgi:hypothetical protein